MVGTVPWGAVAVAIQSILAREQSVQGVHQVVIRASTDLQDDQAGRGMRHEDGQQAIVPACDVREERRAGRRQVGDPPGGPGPDAELAGLYGKMLRRASRRRPRPPPAGADS